MLARVVDAVFLPVWLRKSLRPSPGIVAAVTLADEQIAKHRKRLAQRIVFVVVVPADAMSQMQCMLPVRLESAATLH